MKACLCDQDFDTASGMQTNSFLNLQIHFLKKKLICTFLIAILLQKVKQIASWTRRCFVDIWRHWKREYVVQAKY